MRSQVELISEVLASDDEYQSRRRLSERSGGSKATRAQKLITGARAMVGGRRGTMLKRANTSSGSLGGGNGSPDSTPPSSNRRTTGNLPGLSASKVLKRVELADNAGSSSGGAPAPAAAYDGLLKA